jgi:hypothetical protein
MTVIGTSIGIRRVGRVETEEEHDWAEFDPNLPRDAAPWRTFRWHRGQRHYSGTFWSCTERGHVIYESRLELARLLYADFSRSVRRILAQPFRMRAEVDGILRRHVPDYLLLTEAGQSLSMSSQGID